MFHNPPVDDQRETDLVSREKPSTIGHSVKDVRPRLTREQVIAILGAIAGYLSFLAILVYPVGAVVLCLQLYRTGYALNYSDAWYGAWLAPHTVIVPNVLSVLLGSLLLAGFLYLSHLIGEFLPSDLYAQQWAKREERTRNEVTSFKVWELTLGRRQDVGRLRKLAYVASYLSIPIILIPVVVEVWVIVFIGIYFPWEVLGLWLFTALLCAIAFVAIVRIEDNEVSLKHIDGGSYDMTPQSIVVGTKRVGTLLNALIILVVSFAIAVYSIGYQNPRLPSGKFANTVDEYALVAYSMDYWYVFDCNRNLSAIHKDDTGGRIDISTSSTPCNRGRTPGWRIGLQWITPIVQRE